MWVIFFLNLILPLKQDYTKELSLYEPHIDHFGGSHGWTSLGVAVASYDKIILTGDRKDQKGSIWLYKPITIRNWEIKLDFRVYGSTGSFFGDGFAFWYIQTPQSEGNVFGSHDYFKGLGIMFDTYSNRQDSHLIKHPMISAQLNDGTVHYDHDKDGTATFLSQCSFDYRGEEHTAIISYYGSNSTLLVYIKSKLRDEFTECFKTVDVILPTGYFIGLSAMTGDLSDNHEILSLKFYNKDHLFKYENPNDFKNIIPKGPTKIVNKPKEIEEPVSSIWWKIFKRLLIGAFILILSCIFTLIVLYYVRKREKERRKRFY